MVKKIRHLEFDKELQSGGGRGVSRVKKIIKPTVKNINTRVFTTAGIKPEKPIIKTFAPLTADLDFSNIVTLDPVLSTGGIKPTREPIIAPTPILPLDYNPVRSIEPIIISTPILSPDNVGNPVVAYPTNDLIAGELNLTPYAPVPTPKPTIKMITIKGILQANDNTPIYGVVKSQNNATIYTESSFQNGKFALRVPATDMIEFSSVGFEDLIIPASQVSSVVTLQIDKDNVIPIDLGTIPTTNHTSSPLAKVETPNNTKKWLIGAGSVLGFFGLISVLKPKNSTSKKEALAGGKTTKSNFGKTANGTLKKGYKYVKGGKIVKVKNTKKKSSLNAGVVDATI